MEGISVKYRQILVLIMVRVSSTSTIKGDSFLRSPRGPPMENRHHSMIIIPRSSIKHLILLDPKTRLLWRVTKSVHLR